MFSNKLKSVGLSISDHSIKIVELKKRGKETTLSSKSLVLLEYGIVENGIILDKEKLSTKMEEALAKASPNPIKKNNFIFSIPENLVFTHIFLVPKKDYSQIEEIAKKEAWENIPVENKNLVYSFRKLEEKDGVVKVLLAGIDRVNIDSWNDFFNTNKIEIEAIHFESICTIKSLFKDNPKEPVFIIDMGAKFSNIYIADQNGLFYSFISTVAGENINNIIKKSKIEENDLSPEKIEEFKITQDFFANDSMSYALKSSIEPLILDIIKASLYYKSRKGISISKIILIGGSSNLKGLSKYLENRLSSELSVIAEKGSSIESNHVIAGQLLIPGLDNKFAASLGSALRGYSKKEAKDAICLPQEKNSRKNICLFSRKQGLYRVDSSRNVTEQMEIEEKMEEEEDKGEKKKIYILLLILLVGAILLGLSYWYRISNLEKVNDNPSIDSAYVSKSFSFDIPLSATSSSGNLLKIKEHKNSFKEPVSHQDILSVSQKIVKAELIEGEKLWTEPVDDLPEEIIFPFEIKYFSYVIKDLNEIVISLVEENVGHKNFSSNNISIKSLKNNNGELFFEVIVEILISDDLSKKDDEKNFEDNKDDKSPEKEEPALVGTEESDNKAPSSLQELSKMLYDVKDENSVEIVGTPYGWLNIRNGPGTEFDIVDRVDEGAVFEEVSSSNGWVEIKQGTGTAWVYEEYVLRLNLE